MGSDLSSATPYSGPSNVNYTSQQEAKDGKGADGQSAAPAGTSTVAVDPGDSISQLMARAQPPLDWNNPEHREQFLRDNPQFRDRDPNLIYPGEVLYIRTAPADTDGDGTPETPPDSNGDGVPDPATDTDNDGRPDPVNGQQAAVTTDQAAQDLADAEQSQAEYMRGPGSKGLRHEYQEQVDSARQRLNAAIQAEIEQGLSEYAAANPNATPQQLQTEAERLANQAQGRTGTASEIPDATMDSITQNAINNFSAEQRGIDLDRVAPGTQIQDGPYTDASGPFEPNSTVTLRDGTEVYIGPDGYPTSADGEASLAPNPGTSANAESATSEAAASLERAYDVPNQIPERQEMVSDARTRLQEAMQREIELGLQQWLEQNPGASEQELQAQATTLAEAIQQREGENLVSDSMVTSAAAAASTSATSTRYN